MHAQEVHGLEEGDTHKIGGSGDTDYKTDALPKKAVQDDVEAGQPMTRPGVV